MAGMCTEDFMDLPGQAGVPVVDYEFEDGELTDGA